MNGRHWWIPIWCSTEPELTPKGVSTGGYGVIILLVFLLAGLQAACSFPRLWEETQLSPEPVISPLPSLIIEITPSQSPPTSIQMEDSPTQTLTLARTQTIQPELEIIDVFSEELNDIPKYKINLNKPLLSGGQDLVRNFNQRVYQLYKEEMDDFIQLSEESEEWRSQIMPDSSSWLDLRYELGYLSDEFISLNFPVEVYIAGMAHPNHYNRVLTYDLQESRPLQLKDLFISEDHVLPIIASYCADELNKRDELIFEEGVKPSAANYKNWVITQQGLSIVFDPYQVAPGAAGTLKVNVPWEIFSEEINPQGPLVRFLPE